MLPRNLSLIPPGKIKNLAASNFTERLSVAWKKPMATAEKLLRNAAPSSVLSVAQRTVLCGKPQALHPMSKSDSKDSGSKWGDVLEIA